MTDTAKVIKRVFDEAIASGKVSRYRVSQNGGHVAYYRDKSEALDHAKRLKQADKTDSIRVAHIRINPSKADDYMRHVALGESNKLLFQGVSGDINDSHVHNGYSTIRSKKNNTIGAVEHHTPKNKKAKGYEGKKLYTAHYFYKNNDPVVLGRHPTKEEAEKAIHKHHDIVHSVLKKKREEVEELSDTLHEAHAGGSKRTTHITGRGTRIPNIEPIKGHEMKARLDSIAKAYGKKKPVKEETLAEGKIPLKCNECGHHFKKTPRGVEAKCPKCKGYDTEFDYSYGGPKQQAAALRKTIVKEGFTDYKKAAHHLAVKHGPFNVTNAHIKAYIDSCDSPHKIDPEEIKAALRKKQRNITVPVREGLTPKVAKIIEAVNKRAAERADLEDRAKNHIANKDPKYRAHQKRRVKRYGAKTASWMDKFDKGLA